jgi:hypothetical protein
VTDDEDFHDALLPDAKGWLKPVSRRRLGNDLEIWKWGSVLPAPNSSEMAMRRLDRVQAGFGRIQGGERRNAGSRR